MVNTTIPSAYINDLALFEHIVVAIHQFALVVA